MFHDEDMGIDLGGIGKGYGVDRAVAVLREWGFQNGLVNVGGDLYAMGVSEDGDPWNVGVRSPDDPQGLVANLAMSDQAVATSGDYHQYFEHDGRRYHHLLDPTTGAPAEVTDPECDRRCRVLYRRRTPGPRRRMWLPLTWREGSSETRGS